MILSARRGLVFRFPNSPFAAIAWPLIVRPFLVYDVTKNSLTSSFFPFFPHSKVEMTTSGRPPGVWIDEGRSEGHRDLKVERDLCYEVVM
jgi:hypothetical protein